MKKFLALFMAVIMIASIGMFSAFAEDVSIDTAGGNGNTDVELTVDAATFKVTVPTVLPFSVDENGVVTVATNAQISNLSNGPVVVTDVTAKTTGGWELVENGTDFRAVQVDSPKFTMTLNGDNFPAGTTSVLPLGSAWAPINGQANMALPYDGDFAEQSELIDTTKIADVIFTIGWYTV